MAVDRTEFEAFKSDIESRWPGLTVSLSDDAEKWKQEGRQELLDELGIEEPAKQRPLNSGDENDR